MSTKDYVGFTYNGVHSSELGIVRTSDGSRFNENLLPTMQDKTAQVPGGDGTYYFGSYYTQRVFNIPFAFDSLTEEQLARLKAVFGDKGIHDLIFDEVPYKIYSAKVTGSATLKYIPFAEGDTNRIYKGEGSVQFTCFQPFARSRYKYLDAYDKEEFPNKDEWAAASGMKETQGNYDKNSSGEFKLYNAGDLPTNIIFRLPFGKDSSTIPASSIALGEEFLQWGLIKKKGDDAGIYVDSRLNLIYGYSKEVNNILIKTENVYNEYLTDGAFFKIPKGESVLKMGSELSAWYSSGSVSYDFLYF